MSEPIFLTVGQVERLHQKAISRFGGASGIRDAGLFGGAILQSRYTYFYANGDLFDIAAAYAFHISVRLKLALTVTNELELRLRFCSST